MTYRTPLLEDITGANVLPVAVAAAVCLSAIGRLHGDETAPMPEGFSAREIRVESTDGSTRERNDRTLQEAIDRMAKSGGGTVRIGPGRFAMRNALMLRDNVRVVGAGEETILASEPGATTRLAQDAAHGRDRIVLADAADFRVGDGVAIRDDRSPSAFAVTTATLVEKIGPTTFRLSTPLVKDYTIAQNATVVRAFPVLGGWNVENVAVEGLAIDGNRREAEALDGCRGAGIYLYACRRAAIRHCTVRNYRGDGISFQWGSQNVTVEDCLVEDCAVFGLHPGGDSHDCVVRRNRAIGNGGPGLFVCESVKHVLFAGNELRRNEGPGVSIGCRDTDNLFRGNTITDNAMTGVLFRDDGGEPKGAHRNVFEKNTILDNGASQDAGRPAACVTILGNHRDLMFRENTLGNTQTDGPAAVGILVVGEAAGLASEANRCLNLTKEIQTP